MIRYFKNHIFNSISGILKKPDIRRSEVPKTCAIGPCAEILDSHLDEEVRIAANASVRFSKVGYLTAIGRSSKVTHSQIGKFCAISWDSTINAIGHPHENLTVSAFPYVPYVGGFVTERVQHHKNVIIKNDVWIGANSVVMPGLIIGNGAIVGANAVVTKNVPDYAIVAGVPAKILRYRFSEEMVKRLLAISWWDWDKQIIKANIHLFQAELDEEKLKELERACP